MAMFALAFALPETLSESSTENKRSIIKESVKLSAPSIAYGGTLVIGDSNQPTLINPILTDHSVSISVMTVVFNRLIRSNPQGELEPDLATFWDISEDGLVYTFYLREGVKFHDGIELTAEDVCYTYETIKDPSTHSSYLSDMNIVEKFEVVDKYTFRVRLKQPYTPFLYKLVREIAPRHLYQNADIHHFSFNYKPIGTGPFKFKEWKGNQITLEANEEYFEGRPYLDQIVFKTYPTRSEVWSAFMRQEIDLVRLISIEDYEVTKRDPTFKTFSHAGLVYCAILYNLKDPILSDKRVRQAIAHSIDKKKIIGKAEKGYGVESLGPFSKESWGFSENIQPYSYDPDKAVSILNEAGWQRMDQNGIRIKNEAKLVLKLLVDSRNEKLKTIAMMLRQQLQEVGIALQIRLYSNNDVLVRESVSAQAQLRMEFGGGADPGEVAKLWHSSQWPKARLWFHDGQLASEIDELIYLGQTTQERDVRKKIYNDLHEKIYQEQLACFLYFPSFFHAVSAKVQNAELFLNARMPDYILKDFYLDPKRGGGDYSGDNQ
jgi:peptide/nickel transport system substrate-binding protein